MKNMKKLASLLLALVMVFSLATTAFAQEKDSGKGGTATITIKNAAKGETYKVVKIFDASLNADSSSIVYTGTIPAGLGEVFTTNDAGNIVVADGKNDKDVTDAVAAYAKTLDATASEVSNGEELTFTGLEYGYYAVITTQGSAVTVDSTNPNAVVYDKNSNEPKVVKEADDKDVYIGETVTYTLTSDTSNYLGEGEDAELVTKYVISDNLPAFLTDVTVTEIKIVQDPTDKISDAEDATEDQKLEVTQLPVEQFGADKKIEITWVDNNGNSLYRNGSQIVITYTAKVSDTIKDATVNGVTNGDGTIVDGTGNKNTVTLTAYTDDDTPDEPWEKTWTEDETIKTYAATLKKVDDKNNALAGAKFKAKGLTVMEQAEGYYVVTGYDAESSTLGTEMTTDNNGKLIIVGLPSDVTLKVTETEAPAGYNKLATEIDLKATIINEAVTVTSTTVYYNADGSVSNIETETSESTVTYNTELVAAEVEVVNKSGTELPSTGGMGTTLFYVFGSILVIGAAVLLVTKKRMGEAQ